MVRAFLKAEIDSPRFGPTYARVLSRSNLDRSDLIDNADLANARANELRVRLLQVVRGYRANQYLFQGFPADVRWRRIRLGADDYPRLRYANFPTWTTLTGGTRRVLDGAKNIDSIQTAENANANIRAVADQVRRGRRYPELIAVEGNPGALILVEGHTRATAYVLAGLADPTDIIVGVSPAMNHWVYY